MTDVLSDGQRLVAGFTPAFSVTDRNGTITGSFTQVVTPDLVVDLSQIGNDTDPATDGSTRLVFNVSQALVNAGAADGILQGGRSVAEDAGPAHGTLTFRTTIQERFSDTYLPNTPNVSEGDDLQNGVTIEGSIRDNNELATILGTEQDTSHCSVIIVVGTLSKAVYAVNGSTALTSPVHVAPGDLVTYRFTYQLPTTDFDGLSLVDYLPLPIFDATTLTTFDATVSAGLPCPGHAETRACRHVLRARILLRHSRGRRPPTASPSRMPTSTTLRVSHRRSTCWLPLLSRQSPLPINC